MKINKRVEEQLRTLSKEDNKQHRVYINPDAEVNYRTAADRVFKEFKLRGGKVEDKEIAMKKLEEYLGDKASEECNFRFYDIPETDRLRYYQLLIKYAHFRTVVIEKDEDKEASVWNQLIKPCIENAKTFEIDSELIPILMNTKAEPTKLPFDFMALDCKIPIKDRIYYGLLIGKLTTDSEGGFADVPYRAIISCYSYLYNGERQIEFEFISFNEEGELPLFEQKKHNPYQKEILNFFFSFCHFLNEPDVKYIPTEFSEKNNQRRNERGRMSLPRDSNFIRIYGNLRNYIDNYNQGIKKGFSHKFYVRGHFLHFRNQKRYKNIYALSPNQIKELGYNLTDGIIKRWKKPYIKGHGILINKDYIVKQ